MNTVNDLMIQLLSSVQVGWFQLDERRRSEHGEGVISTAIAVLIMVGLGAAMWAVYKTAFDDSNNTVATQIKEIGVNKK
jgi:hypothetical protein